MNNFAPPLFSDTFERSVFFHRTIPSFLLSTLLDFEKNSGFCGLFLKHLVGSQVSFVFLFEVIKAREKFIPAPETLSKSIFFSFESWFNRDGFSYVWWSPLRLFRDKLTTQFVLELTQFKTFQGWHFFFVTWSWNNFCNAKRGNFPKLDGIINECNKILSRKSAKFFWTGHHK